MSKLPKPFAIVNETPLFTSRTVKQSYEQGRRDMLDEVLRIAPDSISVLLDKLKEGK